MSQTLNAWADKYAVGPAALEALYVTLERTPGARWREAGEHDPHGGRYDCERAALAMGHLTDDELANAVYLHGDERPRLDKMLSKDYVSPSAYLTAAKDRIRWLSRKLAEAEQLAIAAEDANTQLRLEKDAGRGGDYVDPVTRHWPNVQVTGWTATTVEHLFAVLSQLSKTLRGAEGEQLLARVWRTDSPVLKLISGFAATVPALTDSEREWLQYAIDHMRAVCEPEDSTCADTLELLLARTAPTDSCRCVDCGGDQPGHSADCRWMAELHGTPAAPGIDLSKLQLYRMASGPIRGRKLYKDDTGTWVRIQDVERLLAGASPKGGESMRDWSLRMAKSEEGQHVGAGAHGLQDSPKGGMSRDDAEQVIGRIMGEYDFSMPSRAYAELVDAMQATSAEVGECNCPNGRAEHMPDCASQAPASGSWWTHTNGKRYQVKAIANIAHRHPNHPITVVYRGEYGHWWTRPLSDWHRSMKPEVL